VARLAPKRDEYGILTNHGNFDDNNENNNNNDTSDTYTNE
jgi:hypothetical protein